MFRRILLALDGSTFSEHALPFAIDVARRARAELILMLVHVKQTPATTDIALRDAIDEWESTHARQEAEYLENLAARMAREHGIQAVPRLRRGDVVPAIEDEVAREKIDLVVMTTHGRAGLERAWLGSVADALLRHLDVPVLLVRPAEQARPQAGAYRHVLVALDGSELAERSIEPALALAAHDARVTFLRVVSPPSGVTSPYLPHAARLTQEEMEQRTQEATRYVEEIVARPRANGRELHAAVIMDYHAAHAILGYARERDVDLIALSTHGRGPVGRLLLGSVTDKVVRAADVPVLVS